MTNWVAEDLEYLGNSDAGVDDALADRLTELAAAERFARLHGDDIRFDHRQERTLLWSRHRWTPDTDGAVFRVLIDFVRGWQRQALDVPDRDKREALLQFVMKLERRDKLTNMLTIARNLKPIADAGDQWDQNRYLLGVPNGVVDLRTGILRPGRREDSITLQTAIPFDPLARCPKWEQFLLDVFAGDCEMVNFVHRGIGYSVTGDTGEQCCFMDHGVGGNGKGTLLNTVRQLLGDYGHALPFSAIEYDPRPGAASNELAALLGRRFVVASETNEGKRLNEGRIKWLTGGDPIRARFLYAESFEFLPTAKFWLAVNHKPIVSDDSHGFWRRIRLIPFTQTFPVNPRFADDLYEEAPGILAWAVRGALEWQRLGLTPPAAVVAATGEYQADSDPLAAFINEATELDPLAEVRATELYDTYKRWAEQQGLSERERMSSTRFGRRMAERLTRRKTRDGMVYQGIARRV